MAALFAVHPQHVESVAWIAERRDVLSGLFFVLTLGAWLGYVRHERSLARYCLVALLLGLGLMSKAMLVTVPPLLLRARLLAAGSAGPGGRLAGEFPESRQANFHLAAAGKAAAGGDRMRRLRDDHGHPCEDA